MGHDDYAMFNAAHEAFEKGDIERLEALAQEKNFPLGEGPIWDGHCLSQAIMSANVDSVAWVLSKEVEVNYTEAGFSPLKMALQMEKDSHMFPPRCSVKPGAELTIRLLDMLIDAGTDIHIGDSLGATALHTAAMWSSPAVVRHLLTLGADPLRYDKEYEPRQPVYYAQFYKRPEIVEILEEAIAEKLRPIPKRRLHKRQIKR